MSIDCVYADIFIVFHIGRQDGKLFEHTRYLHLFFTFQQPKHLAVFVQNKPKPQIVYAVRFASDSDWSS